MGVKGRTVGKDSHISIRQEEWTYHLQQPPCLLCWQCRETPYLHPAVDDAQIPHLLGLWSGCYFFIGIICQKDQTRRAYLIVKKGETLKLVLAPIVAERLWYYEDGCLTPSPLPDLPPLALPPSHPSLPPFPTLPISVPTTHSERRAVKGD